MATFRARRPVVGAVQFTADHLLGNLPAGVVRETGDNPEPPPAELAWCYVVTADGKREYLRPGDWVVTDGGQYWRCPPDVFAATYEPVES